MAKLRRKAGAKSQGRSVRGRKPVFNESQRAMIEKICLQIVRRETTQKGRPALTDRQHAVVRRIIGEVIEGVLKHVGKIDAMPPDKKRRTSKRKKKKKKA